MTLTRLAPPAVPPATTADLAAHLRLVDGFLGADPAAEEPQLARCLAAATQAVERAIAGALIRQTWVWTRRAWPCAGPIALPLAPVSAILSVARLGSDGAPDVLPSDAYVLDQAGARPALRWRTPPSPASGPGGVSITFEAGYGPAPSDVPADLAQAVLLLAAHYFERRFAADLDLAPIPHGVATLLDPHRPIRLGADA